MRRRGSVHLLPCLEIFLKTGRKNYWLSINRWNSLLSIQSLRSNDEKNKTAKSRFPNSFKGHRHKGDCPICCYNYPWMKSEFTSWNLILYYKYNGLLLTLFNQLWHSLWPTNHGLSVTTIAWFQICCHHHLRQTSRNPGLEATLLS